MGDEKAAEWTRSLLDSLLPDDWQFKHYPLDPLADEDGTVPGCYRTPPAPSQ